LGKEEINLESTIFKRILKEKHGYKSKNPAVLEGKMPISRKVLAKKVGYKARKWGFSSYSHFYFLVDQFSAVSHKRLIFVLLKS